MAEANMELVVKAGTMVRDDVKACFSWSVISLTEKEYPMINHWMWRFAVCFVVLFMAVGSAFAQHTVTTWRDNKAGAVSLTFDDGWPDHLTVAVPAMDARGFKGTLFLYTSYASSDWGPWVAAANSGHELGSHTVTHPNLAQMDLADAEWEIEESKRVIESQLGGKRCVSLAYPYGDSNASVRALVESAGYINARNVFWDLNSPPYNFYNLNAYHSALTLDQMKTYTAMAEQQGEWMVTLFHCLDGRCDWTESEFIVYLDYLKGRNVWVAPEGSVVKYIKERAAAILSEVSNTGSEIVVSLTDTFDNAIYDEPLTIRSVVPAAWGSSVRVQQGGNTVTVPTVVEGSVTVAYYSVVPDAGLITLSSGSTSLPPTISSLSPTLGTAGGPAFTLTVNGTNFVAGSIVRWNGSNRTTAYVGATQLTAAISSADIATAGIVSVTVMNPGSGQISNGVAFLVNGPNLSSLTPASAIAGGPGFTLTVNGSNFVTGSVVRWNGSSRITTFVSASQLTAAIQASDLTTAGTVAVSVINPGGSTSNSVNFTVNNPVPTLASLSPTSATAGGPAFTLTVTGTNFVSGSVVRWNGTDRTTTYVSATQLTAAISSTDIANAGTASVTVFTPTPGGGTSGALTFTINAANNPAPTLTTLNPTSATAGGPAFTLTVTGTNFVNGSVVQWKGSNRTTVYVSSTQLTASITAADIAAAGTAAVTVFTPTPGGGTSNGLSFQITQSLPSITLISPSSCKAGSAGFYLTVYGANYTPTSVVRWKSTQKSTTYVSATELQVWIAPTDVAKAGNYQVTVRDKGQNSNGKTFTVTR